MRWFYAVDVPNSKPGWNKYTKTREPEKFLPFSEWDSFNLEVNFRKRTSDPVEVNEDRLFQVDLNKLELSPVYWEGPIYEVRRGIWFDSNGVPFSIKQTEYLEQGYVKVKPYTFKHSENEVEEPNSKDNKEIISKFNKYMKEVEESQQKFDLNQEQDIIEFDNERYVMYLDSKNAVLFPQTYDTNFQIDVIRQFGTSSGALIGVTLIQRGYSEDLGENIFDKLSTTTLPSIADSFQDEFGSILGYGDDVHKQESESSSSSSSPSLVVNENDLDDQHMQQYLEEDYDLSVSKVKSHREIDHLVLCIHGIGQVLGTRYESINFTHNINVLRTTMKKVYNDNDHYKELAYPNAKTKDETYNTNNRIQVLPISWRHKIGFNPGESIKDKNPRLPTLSQINVDGIRALRNVIGDVVLDVLLYYEPKYLEQILLTVSHELNRVYHLYMSRNPNFKGKVHILGHSLGSAIAFDLVCGHTGTKYGDIETPSELDFNVDSLFLAGSPVGMFKLLEGKNITSIFDDKILNGNKDHIDKLAAPKCRNLYNIFHPCDPIAYRIEPLISPRFGDFKAEEIPFASKGIVTQIKELYTFSDEITGKISQARNWFRNSKTTTTTAKSLEPRADEENALGDIISNIMMDEKKPDEPVKLTKRNMTEDELLKLLALNNTGRVDYCLPMGVLDISLISAVSAHISYFDNQDASGFIMKELLEGRQEPVDKKSVSLY